MDFEVESISPLKVVILYESSEMFFLDFHIYLMAVSALTVKYKYQWSCEVTSK